MVWRIKNRHTFKVCRFKNRQYSKSMPILNSAYFTAWYDDMTSAFGKVCRIKNRHTFKSMPILNSAYFTECRFVIRHITQTETQTETELLRRHATPTCYVCYETFDIQPTCELSLLSIKLSELIGYFHCMWEAKSIWKKSKPLKQLFDALETNSLTLMTVLKFFT